MEKNEKVLSLLGLAYRAKKIINGEESVLYALKQGKCKLVLVACDASSKTIDRLEKKCFFYKVEINKDFSTDELSMSIGKGLVKVMALTDQGFFDSLKKVLK